MPPGPGAAPPRRCWPCRTKRRATREGTADCPGSNQPAPAPAPGARGETPLQSVRTNPSPPPLCLSWILQSVPHPDGAVVEGAWQPEQALAKPIKEAADRGPGQEQLHGANHAEEAAAPGERNRRQLLQTNGADHTVIVLRDAFPTEKSMTLRAPRHRFASGMVETSLVTQTRHVPKLHG